MASNPQFDSKIKRTSETEEAERLFKALVEDGSKIDGDIAAVDSPEDIEWYDPEKVRKGQQFGRENLAVLQLVLLAANCVGFTGKQIASVFFKNFFPKNSCGLRFLSTLKTVSGWHSDPTSSTFIKEISKVRKLHRLYARPKVNPRVPPKELVATYPPEYTELIDIVKADLKDVDTSEFPAHLVTWEPSKYFTQFDVALVQFGGVAPYLLYPDKVGLYTSYETDEGLRAYFHFIAVTGRLLGLEDKYNLALHPNRELYHKIVTQFGLGSLKNMDETVVYSMTTLARDILPGVTIKALLYATLRTSGVKGEGLWKSMNWRDKLCVIIMGLNVYLFRFTIVRIVANNILHVIMQYSFNKHLKSEK